MIFHQQHGSSSPDELGNRNIVVPENDTFLSGIYRPYIQNVIE